MNAYEIPSLRWSLISGALVTRRRFLKIDSSEQAVHCGAGEAAIGVSMVNATAAGEVMEIADGIVIVESGAAVSIGAVVQSDSTGRAITRTTGYILGVALTASAAAGQYIAVKTPAVAAPDSVQVIVSNYQIENLAAGGDLANIPVFVVPTGYTFTLTSAVIIPQGDDAGIDAENTSVITIKEAAATVCSETYDGTTTFPDSGVAGSLGTIANASGLVAGKVLCLNVTNGATADLPATLLQLTGTLTAVA